MAVLGQLISQFLYLFLLVRYLLLQGCDQPLLLYKLILQQQDQFDQVGFVQSIQLLTVHIERHFHARQFTSSRFAWLHFHSAVVTFPFSQGMAW